MYSFLILMAWLGSQPFTLKTRCTLAFEDGPAKIYSMTTDDEGNLYATILLASQILVFNAAGEALPPLGVSGQGPGELQYPMALTYNHGFLYTVDNGKGLLNKINPKTNKVEKEWKVGQAYSIQISGNQLLMALESPVEGKMFALYELNDTLKIYQRLFESPCCLEVMGSRTGGAAFDPDGGIWVSYSGEYLIEKFQKGKMVRKISAPPPGYVRPSPGKNTSRYDREGAKKNFVSFDKIRGIFKVNNFLLVFRQKSLSDSSLDIFDSAGKAKATIPLDNIVPFQVKNDTLFARQVKNDEVVSIVNLTLSEL